MPQYVVGSSTVQSVMVMTERSTVTVAACSILMSVAHFRDMAFFLAPGWRRVQIVVVDVPDVLVTCILRRRSHAAFPIGSDSKLNHESIDHCLMIAYSDS